jgi:oxygen-dependent protoporphyrinogen oxidase
MASLIDALARRLPDGTVHCGVSVNRLERNSGGGWTIRTNRPGLGVIQADGVILATPVQTAGRLLASVDPDLSSRLGQISSTSCAIVSLGYRREQIAHALDGFGFVVPKVENRQILSGSFSSVKFPGRGPEGTALIRTFLGGAFHPYILDRDDEELARLAADELGGLLGVTGTPLIRHVSRWPEVMPQYELGHAELVREIESAIASHRGLGLAGNAYHGVGVPQCIQSGEQAAEQIATALALGSPRVVENQLGA